MKEDLQKVVRYLIQEWLAFVVLFGIVALVFNDIALLGWAILGGMMGKWHRDRNDKN